MNPSERYDLLEALLLRAQALGTATDEQLDALLDEMDEVWDAMTEDEQRRVDARAKARATAFAPEGLGLRDTEVAIGDHRLPRQAA